MVFDELSRRPTERYMRELEERIAAVDGISASKIAMACVNDSVEAAQLLAPLDMNDSKNWGKLKIVMLPEFGKIMGYFPCKMLEEFKIAAAAGKNSYGVFKKILDDAGGDSA